MPSKKICVSAEYIWVHNNELCSKTRTIQIQGVEELEVKNISKWHYNDGDEKITLLPLNIFSCPFRGQNGILVYCKTGNTKLSVKNPQGTYAFSQEYYIINPNTTRPYGFTVHANPSATLNYTSGVGLEKCTGRKFADLHYKLCLVSGISISEMTCSDRPSKWRYTVKTTTPNDLSSHMWMTRYILHRVGENCNVVMDINPQDLTSKYWSATKCTLTKNGDDTIHDGDCDVNNIL
jgi:glutamine synthetase